MTTFQRFTITVFSLLAFAVALLSAPAASAAPAFSVTLVPAASQFPAGGEAVLGVHLEGETALLPGLQFDVMGGDLVGVDPLSRLSSTAAAGAVHVSRATPGNVRVSASFGGAVLATGEARFVQLGTVEVTVSLAADANAAARTWRFEVVNASGAVADTIQLGTSGDALSATGSSAALPYGAYTVRQILGNDTKLSCTGGAFYALTEPATGAVAVDLNSATAAVRFALTLCPGAPKLSFQAPIDTVGPALPETPINEVRGARSSGPGADNTPLPPDTGAGAAATPHANTLAPLILLVAILLLAMPAAYAAATLSRARRR